MQYDAKQHSFKQKFKHKYYYDYKYKRAYVQMPYTALRCNAIQYGTLPSRTVQQKNKRMHLQSKMQHNTIRCSTI